MGKNNVLSNFFNVIELYKDIDYDNFYNKLIFKSDFIDDSDTLKNIFKLLIECNKSLDKERKLILIEEGIDFNYNKLLFELNGCFMLSNFNDVINNLIKYLKKKKIKFRMEIISNGELCRFKLIILEKDNLIKIIDYINDKLGKNIEEINCLYFGDDKVNLSFNMDYSYDDILIMYLYDFINFSDIKVKSYIGFKKYILDNYFKITNQVNMYELLKFNRKDICLSKFFYNLEVITTLIVYFINEKDIEDYCDYFRKLKKNEFKNINVYNMYDDLELNRELFNELVSKMYSKYGEEYAKNSIISYINTGKRGYITRENDLRKRIIDSKTFMIFLYKIDFEVEFNKLVEGYKINEKMKILENICCETYFTCNDLDKVNSGKIHIARTLIRISYGDYSSITRKNDARKIAIENIKPEDVVCLIKQTLKIEYVKKEARLYELYAEYIENLCVT